MLRKLAILLLIAPVCASATSYVATASGNISALVPTCATGGDTVTVDAGVTLTVDENCILGNSPSSGFVLTAAPTSTVALSLGVTLTLRGGFSQGGALTVYGGASTPTVLLFDASQAPAPMTTNYEWVMGSTAGQSATIQTSGTTATGYFLATSNPAGGNAYGLISAGTNTWNVSYFVCAGLGTATLNSIVASGYSPGTHAFHNAVFNGCGEVQFPNFGSVNTGLDVQNSAWKNSLGTYAWVGGSSASATQNATRQIINSAFDKKPEIGNGGLLIQNDYFDVTWFMQGAGAGKTTFIYNLVHNINGNQPNQLPGTEGYNYFVTDYWPAPALSSTVTSATATTLTDNSVVLSSYASTTVNGWEILTTGGTGPNQLVKINSNTAHTFQVSPAWAVLPDATTTYEVIDGPGNVHMLAVNSGTHVGDIGDCTNAYGTGKLYLNSGLSAPITMTNAITLPSPSGANCAALFDFGTSSSANTVTATHNTVYTGGFNGAYVDDYLDNHAAGYILADSSSLFWTNPSNVSNNQCGSVVIEDNQHCTSGGVLNYGLPTAFDYNAKWSLNNGTYFGNGYAINESAAPGAHDVNLAADDGPNFVDPTRDWISWCESLGITGLLPDVSTQCRAALLNANDFTNGGNPAFNPTALYTWVQAGFAPQNILLHDAAEDGMDIGAVPYQAP